jgi:flagellar hook assembly protein FlgD
MLGDVDVATVTFQAIGSGAAGIGLAGVTARDAWNRPVATAVDVAGVQSAVPRTTALAMPWPNPSRGGIALEFALARAGRVELAIYGIDGRRVKVLAQGEREAGEYRLSWDGTDERGHAAAPGVYYARMSADGREFTRKLVRLDR